MLAASSPQRKPDCAAVSSRRRSSEASSAKRPLRYMARSCSWSMAAGPLRGLRLPSSRPRQQLLYFLPLPQGHGSLRPGLIGTRSTDSESSSSAKCIPAHEGRSIGDSTPAAGDRHRAASRAASRAAAAAAAGAAPAARGRARRAAAFDGPLLPCRWPSSTAIRVIPSAPTPRGGVCRCNSPVADDRSL
ncbi:MAG: hypothetical protein AW07_03207 [Candidatus Accumulibacter sp. SK-11]|nr:MAG: hypothetical protein AW07_03207 [Candidatus Accumulibacter sp. SK-11]